MAQSPEYPDLKFVTPASWSTANRKSVQFIVIHTTEGHENATSAEDGAAYDSRRTDGTSAHYFHDQNSTVQCVLTQHVAHTAFWNGNQKGIQHELCGRAGQTLGQWSDAASLGTLKQAAKQCARDAKKWGIPVRKLTPAQVARGDKGFCGHVDITYAFPQDNGDHTDPGKNFPWTQFLGMVQSYLGGTTPPSTESGEMPMGWADEDVIGVPAIAGWDAKNTTGAMKNTFKDMWQAVIIARNNSAAAVAGINALAAAVANIKGVDGAALNAKLDQIRQDVSQVDENVLAALGTEADRNPAEVAQLLKAALGDNAEAVFRAGLGQ